MILTHWWFLLHSFSLTSIFFRRYTPSSYGDDANRYGFRWSLVFYLILWFKHQNDVFPLVYRFLMPIQFLVRYKPTVNQQYVPHPHNTYINTYINKFININKQSCRDNCNFLKVWGRSCRLPPLRKCCFGKRYPLIYDTWFL